MFIFKIMTILIHKITGKKLEIQDKVYNSFVSSGADLSNYDLQVDVVKLKENLVKELTPPKKKNILIETNTNEEILLNNKKEKKDDM